MLSEKDDDFVRLCMNERLRDREIRQRIQLRWFVFGLSVFFVALMFVPLILGVSAELALLVFPVFVVAFASYAHFTWEIRIMKLAAQMGLGGNG